MTHEYELRLRGAVPRQVMAELSLGPRAEQRSETILVTCKLNPHGLHDLLVRISDLGLDIRELRRLPERQATTATAHGG
jgi:hypothetical protein